MNEPKPHNNGPANPLTPQQQELADRAEGKAKKSFQSGVEDAINPLLTSAANTIGGWFSSAKQGTLHVGAAFGSEGANRVLTEAAGKEGEDKVNTTPNDLIDPSAGSTDRSDPRNFPRMIKEGRMTQKEADDITRREWGSEGMHEHNGPNDLPGPAPLPHEQQQIDSAKRLRENGDPGELADKADKARSDVANNFLDVMKTATADAPIASAVETLDSKAPDSPAPEKKSDSKPPTAKKPPQEQSFKSVLAETLSNVKNSKNIGDIEKATQKLAISQAKAMSGGETPPTPPPSIATVDNSSTTHTSSISSTVVSADFLGQLKRSYEQLPSWRSYLG